MDESGLKQSIIKYWNDAGLYSIDSPSSHGSPFIDSCNNYIESKLLEEVINENVPSREEFTCIDIGAGLGRFTFVLAKNVGKVHSLEAAKDVYDELVKN
jgi:tRNA/tmRNA/rRNA uracil-C5-methylase (TrmA/RlmC/RlmD family)